MFSKPSIKSLLNQYTLVQLYTDAIPPRFKPTTSADENRALLNDQFGTAQLPFYVILQPLKNGEYKELARYEEGKINDEAGFAQFLKRPVQANGGTARAEAAK